MKYPTSRELAKWERENKDLDLPRSFTQALRLNSESISTIRAVSKNEVITKIRRRPFGIAQVSNLRTKASK